jgi:hypothetical protein
MTNTEDDDLDLPDHWSEGARDAVKTVLDAREGLDGPEFAELIQAGEMIATADALDQSAREAHFVIVGAKGAHTLHPGISAARQCRSSAAQILHRLTPPDTESFSGRQRATARARWQNRNGGN